MKKITAFFMAFLPIFIVILLFTSGALIKNIIIIPVNSVEIATNTLELKKEDAAEPTYELEAHVLPINASNPDIYWTSSNDDIATVGKETGIVTAKNYGEAKIYATSVDNQTISATCTVEVWDDKIHNIEVDNAEAASYMGLNQKINLQALPVPHNRIKGDPALEYATSDNTIAKVSTDGEVTAVGNGDATITISCADPTYSSIKAEVPIHVGQGVSSIGFEQTDLIEIRDRQYNLFNDIIVYPEQSQAEQKFVTAENFEFTSNNDAVATVDEEGIIHFNRPEEATFTATYKKNKNIKASKTLKSYDGVFKDVSFNRYTFTDDFENYKIDSYIDPTKLYAKVYPESLDISQAMTITSSDEGVVKPIFVAEENTYKFQVRTAGHTTLTASILAEDGSTIKEDKCDIHITQKTGRFFKGDKVKTKSAYFWLRGNVDPNALDNEHSPINWQIEPSDIYDVDLVNEIIHFKKSGSATISDGNNHSFTINCDCSEIETLDINQTSFVVDVGKRYQFTDGTNIWTPKFGLSDNFDVDNDDHSFIPRSGCYDKQATISFNGQTKNIEIIVRENVLDIQYDHTYLPNLVTASYIGIYVPDLVKPKIIPSTATDTTGSKFKLNYSYKAQYPDYTDIYDNTITFWTPGTVDITVSSSNVSRTFNLKSTMGVPSKFLLYTDYYETQAQSGQQIQLNKGQTKTFYISGGNLVKNLSTLEIGSSLTTSHVNDGILDVSAIDYSTLTDEIWFTVKANEIGNDTVMIKSSGFTFYLNVDVTKEITDFDLAVNWQVLTSMTKNTIVTYTNDFILDVILNSPLVADKPYTYNLNSQGAIPVTNNRIDMSSETLIEGTNQLVLKAETGYEEVFEIQKLPISQLSYSLDKETTNNKLFIPAGYVSTTLTVIPNGIVDEDIYERFSLTFADSSIVVTQNNNKFLIEGIAQPTEQTPGYESDFSLTFNGNDTKNYHLSRETITKIVFPGHDNTDKNDQKGLQQVHVFGNQTFSCPEERYVNYYKLPLEIYDYKHDLIKDEQKKKEAWESLIYTTDDQTRVTYGNPDTYNKTGYLKVAFDPKKAYTPEEMYNDTFASGSKHNVNFTVSTPSGYVSRTYEFVTVNGINAYHQDVFQKEGAGVYVLQTNFGLKDDPNSTPLDNVDYHHIGSMYGNGYTINFNAFAMSPGTREEGKDVLFNNVFNTNVMIADEENWNLNNSALSAWGTNEEHTIVNHFAYNTIRNGYIGVHMFQTNDSTYIKNSLFYNNQSASINVNGLMENSTAYVENCVFFNCSSVAMTAILGAVIYLKGDIDVYNFHGKEVLKNVMGYDLSFLWEEFKDVIYAAGVVHKDLPDGIERLNSTLCCPLADCIFLWNDREKKYEPAGKTGNEWTVPHWTQYLDVEIAGIGLQMWATWNNEQDPEAPSYFDEFDQDGKVRWDFMNNQIKKLLRIKSDTVIYPY